MRDATRGRREEGHVIYFGMMGLPWWSLGMLLRLLVVLLDSGSMSLRPKTWLCYLHVTFLRFLWV